MLNTTEEGRPSCFAKLWDGGSPECRGGVDPAYKNEETGSNLREKCRWFDMCGSKTQAMKMEAARPYLDPKNLVRNNNVPTLQPVNQQAPPQQQFVQRFAESFQQQMNQPLVKPMYPQAQQQAPQMQVGYQQMMPVNYQMPAYLSVPEVRYEGEGFMVLLWRTVIRSVGKAIGHSISNLFDTTPLGPPRNRS